MGFRTQVVAPRPRSSSASSRTKRILEQRQTKTLPLTLQASLPQMKTKVIKRKFEDQVDNRTTLDEDTTAHATAHAVTPATQQHGGAVAAAGRVQPPLPPNTASSPAPSPGGKGATSKRAAGRAGVLGRMLGPKADAD